MRVRTKGSSGRQVRCADQRCHNVMRRHGEHVGMADPQSENPIFGCDETAKHIKTVVTSKQNGRHKVATDGFDGLQQKDPKDWVRDSMRPLGWHVLMMCGQGWWVSGRKLCPLHDQDHQIRHLRDCDEWLERQNPIQG